MSQGLCPSGEPSGSRVHISCPSGEPSGSEAQGSRPSGGSCDAEARNSGSSGKSFGFSAVCSAGEHDRKKQDSASGGDLASDSSSSKRVRNLAIFASCAVVWLAIDLASKAACEASGLGSTLVQNVCGLFRLHVVHNYGAAWSMFEGNVVPLALFALVVCGALVAFAVLESKRANVAEMLALGLIFAGGLGNMLDRLFRGFVVDMIDPLFINFPTFNIADIGVTCGIVLLVVCLFLRDDFFGDSSASTPTNKED